MPFIDVRVSVKLEEEKEERIKSKLGEAISLMHKKEAHTMIGFISDYKMYFAGKKMEKCAFVGVNVLYKPSSKDCKKMTGAICEILQEELKISPDSVYVKYHGVDDWGWNGTNF